MPDRPELPAIEYRSPRLFLILGIAGLLLSGVILLSGIAYIRSGSPGWATLCLPPFILGMLALGVYLLFAGLQSVTLLADKIVVAGPFQRREIPCDAIRSVENGARLAIRSGETTTYIHFPVIDTQARLYQALVTRLPIVQAARQERLNASLPLVARPRGSVRVLVWSELLFFGGGLVLSLASWIGGVAVRAREQGFWSVVAQGALLLLMLAIFIITGIYLGSTYVRSYQFLPHTIVVNRLSGVKHYDPMQIHEISLRQEERRLRGIARAISYLEIRFQDGSALRVEPNTPGFPFDYSVVREALELEELGEILRRNYLST